MKLRTWILLASLLPFASFAHAHVGSPDIYAEGQAGPYKLFVVVRPPTVIPGVADVEVRSETPGIDDISITPIPLTGEASKHPPVPEAMKRSADDHAFFTGHLWIMAAGSWQIRLTANGAPGNGIVSIPVPAKATGTMGMNIGLRALLVALGVFLFAGMIGIIGAAASEAKLAPGAPVLQANRRHGYISMTVCFTVMVAALAFGRAWWKAEALHYARNIYKPLQMTATLQPGNSLDLKLNDPGWVSERKLDDFIPDHDHIMHLYLVRWPQMDLVAHLHPDATGRGEFRLALPSLPAGDYHLYADVVHSSGFPETIVGEIKLPAISGRPLAGDDAEGTAKPITIAQTDPPSDDAAGAHPQNFKLPDGYTMVWTNAGPAAARAPLDLQFALLDPRGKPAPDMALYMGMIGHAAFVKTDGSVFAHIHPTGTVSMAAYMIANPTAPMAGMGSAMGSGMSGAKMSMPGMTMTQTNLPNVVGFPYGFPTAGAYRIFVQMKHGQTVETGAFDAVVDPPVADKAS